MDDGAEKDLTRGLPSFLKTGLKAQVRGSPKQALGFRPLSQGIDFCYKSYEVSNYREKLL
jgi:hypothetical protein